MEHTPDHSLSRSRRHARMWGSAIALFGVVAGVAGSTSAAIGPVGASVFVPVTPCRLFDTRPASPVGPRSVPLGHGDTMAQQVTGVNGNCSIPAGATAVAMNVTTTNSTAPSYLTVWPADADRPVASNLNWVAGAPPTPNKVDVQLSAGGAIRLYNLAGTIDVIADVVGFYTGHDHDDRYYTEGEIDAVNRQWGGGAPGEQRRVALGGPEFVSELSSVPVNVSALGVSASNSSPACAIAPLRIPDGSTLVSLESLVYDLSMIAQVSVAVYRARLDALTVYSVIGGGATSYAGTPGQITIAADLDGHVVDLSTGTYAIEVCGLRSLTSLANAVVTYDVAAS